MTSAYIASVYITGDSAEFDSTIEGVSSAGDAAASSIAAAFDALGVQLDAAFSETGAKIDAAFAEMAGGATVASGEMSATMAAAGEEASGALAENLGDAGILAGTALHDGVTEGTEGLADDVGTAGEEAGTALKEGVTASTGEMAEELAGAGVLAGTGLHEGVTEGTEGLEDDLGTVGKDSGAALTEGAGKGLTGIKGMLSNLGVPEGLLGGWGELAVGVGGVTAAGIDLAEKMQSADTAIANSAGISTTAAHQIGTAFLKMSGEFDGKEFATAFALVAGQLKSLQGSALTTAQSVQFMTAAATLATAKQIGLKTATGTLASVMQAYGLKVKTAATASDVLFEASNATGQSVTSVGKAVDKVKTKLGGLAPTLGQLSGLLVDMTDHGETGRAAASSLTTAWTAFLKPAATAAKATDDLNVATKNLTPTLAAYAKQVQAGTLAGTALNTITTTMTAKQQALWATFTSANKAVATAAQAMQKMGITVETATGNMRPLKTIIGQLHDQITGMSKGAATAQLEADGLGTSASKLVGVIRAGPAAFDAATTAVTKMGTAHAAAAKESATLSVEFKTIKATADDWLTEIGQVAIPILGDLVGGLAKVASSIDSVVGWFKKASDPALAVAAAIGAVLTPAIVSWGIATIASTAEAVTGWVTSMGAAIASGDAQEGVWLSTAAAAISSGISQGIEFAETAAGWIASAAEAVASAAVQVASWVAVGVAATAAFIAENAATLGIIAGIAALVAGIVYLATHWSEVWSDIKDWFDDAVSFLRSGFGSLVIMITGPIAPLLLLALHWQQVWTEIKSVAEDVWQFLDGIWDDIKSDVTTIWGDIEGFFKQWWPEILGIMTAGVLLIPALLIKYWHQIYSDVQSVWGDIVSFFEGIPGKIEGALADAGSWLIDVGKDVIDGFLTGLKDAWGAVTSWISNAAGDVVSFFKDPLSIFSPSRVMADEVGAPVVQGILQGMQSAFAGTVLPFIDSASKQISSAWSLGAFTPRAVSPLSASGGSSGALVSALSGGGTVAGAGAAPGPAGATIVINQTNNTNASAHDIGAETGWALRTHTGS